MGGEKGVEGWKGRGREGGEERVKEVAPPPLLKFLDPPLHNVEQ